MVFDGESNGQDICTLADRKAKSSDVSYPKKEKVADANTGMRMIWTWIYLVYGGWIFDDSNQTDLPEAVSTLEANQSWFQLPVESENLMGVEVKTDDSTWKKLKKITLEEIKDRGYAETEFMDTAGNPEFYRPVGNGFKIYPQSDTERATGIKIQVSREQVSFTTSTTNTEPGFDRKFHQAVSTYMALQYRTINTMPGIDALQKEWDGAEDSTGREGGYKRSIKEYYRTKFKENNPPQIRKRPNLVRQYI